MDPDFVKNLIILIRNTVKKGILQVHRLIVKNFIKLVLFLFLDLLLGKTFISGNVINESKNRNVR